jgi:putative acetyltransferase
MKGETAMEVEFSAMSIADFDEVIALWQASEGIGLDDDVDSRSGIAAYLTRNPGISQVARHRDRIVGAVLGGHDGRRGYLHHLVVTTEWRNRGVGKGLVDACLARLASADIRKCNLFVFFDNGGARSFWGRTGWNERTDLRVLQRRYRAENRCSLTPLP